MDTMSIEQQIAEFSLRKWLYYMGMAFPQAIECAVKAGDIITGTQMEALKSIRRNIEQLSNDLEPRTGKVDSHE